MKLLLALFIAIAPAHAGFINLPFISSGPTVVVNGSDVTSALSGTTAPVPGLTFAGVAGKKYRADYQLLLVNVGSASSIKPFLQFPASSVVLAGTNTTGTFPSTKTPTTNSQFGDIVPSVDGAFFIEMYSVYFAPVTSGNFIFGFRSAGETPVTVLAGSSVVVTELN